MSTGVGALATGSGIRAYTAHSVGMFFLFNSSVTFTAVSRSAAEYKIEQRLSYNTDEKGFAIGVEAKSTRVFSKALFERGGPNIPVQDGNREWIPVNPTICEDGTTLPTSINFQAQNGAIWSNWVMDILADEEDVFLSLSPNGWINLQLILAQLKLFNKYTKAKARNLLRLLIIDSHSSHISMQFSDYAVRNFIAIMNFPSRSTHSLQPLDVGIFSLLSTSYSSELRQQQQRSQGNLPVKKPDFYGLFK
jgi:hypothetical protein